ncbi:MAG: hypothetical protein JW741_12195 [Sedimentisphaerales bacterium]|nr:hypothetical protein [Sedimentisphaerales bacterium]
MWQTFTPGCANLTAVEIDVLTISPGRGSDVLTVEIARDGVVLASAACSVEDGFEGLLRFEFSEAVPLVPEQIHELKVRDTGTTQFGWKYGPNTYERGSRYVAAQARPGTDWFFRTYASVEPAGAKYSGGSGTPDDPYEIATAEDLIALGETPEDYDKHFILTADIDLDPNLPGGKVFDKAVIAPDTDPNGTWGHSQGTPFSGTFEGNDHIISNLRIAGRSYLGLFGKLDCGAEIRDLGLEAVEIHGAGDYVGGLVGFNRGGITTSYSTGTVSGHVKVGGLVGNNREGVIATSYSTGLVAGVWWVGGLVGHNSASVTTSYSTSAITGDEYAGGLVGTNEGGITTSYSTGTVSGYDEVGGLVGYNHEGVVATSYSTGVVRGAWRVGGLVGENCGHVTTSYSTAMVNGDGWVGGLVGSNDWGGSITMSCSIGAVSGDRDEDVGGLVGSSDWGGTVVASFWDRERSGQPSSAGGTGLTLTEMQDVATFLNAGWDLIDETLNGTCDYWQMVPGDGPRLRYRIGDSPVMPEGQGTIEQPYLIRDARDLGTVWFEPMAHYRLEATVDLTEINWSMAVVSWFGGTFDGNGYVIGNLHIEGNHCLGLFARLSSGAIVSNLGLEGVDVNGIGNCIGALVGINEGLITASYSTGTISGEGHVGGLVGNNNEDSRITLSYSTCTVSGDLCVGGLVGDTDENGSIAISYSTGAVIGTSCVGGLVGSSEGSVSISYSTGMVSGDRRVGGLVGNNEDGSITMSYSTGTTTGNEDLGGLVGNNDQGSVTASFWDMETSGRTTSPGGMGLTTAEMQDIDTFLNAGWDFIDETENGTEDIWWVLEGQDYPRLWWERGEETPL